MAQIPGDLRIGQSGEEVTPTRRQVHDWLATLLLQRPRLRERYIHFLSAIRRWPRRTRRAVIRKLGAGLTGAALLLALSGAPAHAAVINVANGQVVVNDNNMCSLREAIINANANAQVHDDCAGGAGVDLIVLPAGGNFVINNSYTNFSGATGLPVITEDVVIEGNGSTISRSNNAPNFRLLAIGSGTDSVHVQDLTLRRGRLTDANGGAILVDQGGLVLLDHVTVDISRANGSGNGGAIANMGGSVLIFNHSLISGNVAGGRGGGVYTYTSDFYDVENGKLFISQSVVTGNTAVRGGGVATDGNTGQYADNDPVRLNLLQATISDNEADIGGGLHIDRPNDTVYIGKSTLNGNSASSEGGGIYAGFPYSTTVIIANSTISGNSADAGGGIKNEEMSFLLENTTVTGNSAASEGGGLYRLGGGSITLERSIVSGNSAPVGAETYSGNGTDINSTFTIFGHSGNAGTFYDGGPDPLHATDIVPAQGLAQLLNPALQNLGGHTSVHGLPSGSVALDAAPEADCAAAPVGNKDQRNRNRNQNVVGANTNADCDRGAVERQPLTVVFHLALKTNTAIGSSIYQPNDILVSEGGDTSLFMDGASIGLPATARIVALDVPNPKQQEALMAFATPVKVPGIGRMAANDIVLFTGRFSQYFDGSDVGLTTVGERIDGLAVRHGRTSPIGANCSAYLLISTTGKGQVPGENGRQFRFEAEDVLGFCVQEAGSRTRGVWHMALDASAEGMPAGASTGLAAMANGDLYLSAAGDFFVDEAAGRDPSLVYLFSGGRFIGPEVVPAEAGVVGEVAAFDVDR